MRHDAPAKPRKKTAFVPRLAYGCVGLGLGVIPLCAACSDFGDGFTGILPYLGDAATGAPPDAAPIGVVPYVLDASSDAESVGIRPYIPDASVDADADSDPDAGDDDASSDASGD